MNIYEALILAAIKEREYNIIQTLLDYHPDLINTKNKDGNTLLHIAAEEGQIEIAELFIEKGLDVNALGAVDKTPLHSAVAYNQLKMVKFLIHKKADVNAKTFYKDTPLQYAVSRGNLLEMLPVLIAAGAKVNDNKDFQEWSPLHWAIYENRGHMMQCLLDHGADPNLTDKCGNTPLMGAATWDCLEMAIHLLQIKGNEINLNAKNKEGQTAEDILREKGLYKGKLKECFELVKNNNLTAVASTGTKQSINLSQLAVSSQTERGQQSPFLNSRPTHHRKGSNINH